MSDSINTIVTKEAFEQLDLLEKGLERATGKLAEFLKLSEGNMSIKITYPKDLEKGLEKKAEFLTKIEALEKEAIRLQTALITQEAKNALALSHTNKELQFQTVETKLKNAENIKDAKLTTDLTSKYEKLQIQLKALKKEYAEIALVKGKNSPEALKLGGEIKEGDSKIKNATYSPDSELAKQSQLLTQISALEKEAIKTKKALETQEAKNASALSKTSKELQLQKVETKLKNAETVIEAKLSTDLVSKHEKLKLRLAELKKEYSKVTLEHGKGYAAAKTLATSIQNLEKKIKNSTYAAVKHTQTTQKLTAQQIVDSKLKNTQSQEEAKLTSSLLGPYEKLRIQLKALKKEYAEVALAQGQGSDAAKKLGASIKEIEEKTKNSAYATEKQAEKQKQLSVQQLEDNKMKSAAAREEARLSSTLSSVYAKKSITLNRLRKQYKDVALVQGENSREARRLLKETQRLDAQLKKLDANVGQHQRSVGNYGKAWGGLATVFRSAMGALGIYSALDIGKKLFHEILEIDRLNKALMQITETTRTYKQAKGFIIDLAERTGVSINELEFAYTKFLASAKETNLTLTETQDIFTQTATAGAVLGLSTEQVSGAMRALEQILSKGKVQAEEIRGQLGERLPGAFQILAKSMGKTTEELNKMLEMGEVISDEVLPGFARELERSFNLDQVKKVQTLNAAYGRLGNTFNLMIRDFEEGNNFLSNVFINTLDALSVKLKELGGDIKITTNLFGDFIYSIKNFYKEVKYATKDIELINGMLTILEIILWGVNKLLSIKIWHVWAEIIKFVTTTINGFANAVKTIRQELTYFTEDIKKFGANAAISNLLGINKKIQKSFTDTWDESYKVVEARTADMLAALDLLEQGQEEYISNNFSLAPHPKDFETWPGIPFTPRNWKNPVPHPPKDEDKGKAEEDHTLEDAFNLAKARLKIEIDAQQEIANNEDLFAQQRLTANEMAMRKRLDLVKLIADRETFLAEDRTDLLTQIFEEGEAEKLGIAQETLENVKSILENNFAQRLEQYEKLKEENQMQLEEEEYTLTQSLLAKGVLVEDIEEQVAAMKRKFQRQQLMDLLKSSIKELEIVALVAEDKKEVYKQIHLLRMQLLAIEMEAQGELEGKKATTDAEELEKTLKILSVITEASNAIMDLNDAFSARRIANIEAEIKANNELYGGMLESEKLTEEQRTSIENQRDITNAKLEAKKKKEQIKQAKFQKAQAMMNIIFQTAGAVMTAIGAPPYGLGPILGSPFAIAAAAIGAIQLATVLAQPLPAFEQGKDQRDPYTGPMIWGEKRKEVKVGADGRIEISPNRPTKGITRKGDTIFPSLQAFEHSLSYDEVVKASLLTSIANQHDNLHSYQLESILDSHLRTTRDEMRKGVEDAMRSWKMPLQKQPDLEGVLKRIQKRNV